MVDTPKRVLLVDDDESIVEVVTFALEEQGYEVLVARDGTEAIMRFERDQPDLIVLDVVMPRRSGFIVLDRIQRSHNRAPHIIMVTGNDEPRHREFAASRGVDKFISKPFDVAQLVSAVDALLA